MVVIGFRISWNIKTLTSQLFDAIPRSSFHSLRQSGAYMRQQTKQRTDQATSHYLNQCWNIVYSHLRNTFQWDLERNSYIFIHEKCIWNCLRNGDTFYLGLNVYNQCLRFVNKKAWYPCDIHVTCKKKRNRTVHVIEKSNFPKRKADHYSMVIFLHLCISILFTLRRTGEI